jgi:hypothetical protein
VSRSRQVGKGGKEEDEMEVKNSGQYLIHKVRRECSRWSPPSPAWSWFSGLEKQEEIYKYCNLGEKSSSPCDAVAAVIISLLSPLVCCCFSVAVFAFSATSNPVIFLQLSIVKFESSGKNESSSVNSSPLLSHSRRVKSSHGNLYMP